MNYIYILGFVEHAAPYGSSNDCTAVGDDAINVHRHSPEHAAHEGTSAGSCSPLLDSHVKSVTIEAAETQQLSSSEDRLPHVLTPMDTDAILENRELSKLSAHCNEYDLHDAILGNRSTSRQDKHNAERRWSIPDTDSDDEFVRHPEAWSVAKSPEPFTMSTETPPGNQLNLSNDSEEGENVYSTAQSSSMAIEQIKPPEPPPVSTIPRSHSKPVKNAVFDSGIIFDS